MVRFQHIRAGVDCCPRTWAFVRSKKQDDSTSCGHVMREEQRKKQKRYPISIDVELNTPDISIRIAAVNISQGGLGLQSLKNIRPTPQVNISMTSPVEATFYGTLMWSRHTLVKNLDAYEMGFETDAIIFEGKMTDDPEGKEHIVQKILNAMRAESGR